MSDAVDAHLAGNFERAYQLFRQANLAVVYEWLDSSWVRVQQNVVELHPNGDTKIIPKSERDPDRNIAPSIRAEVLARDGYRCRYCGIPIVHADIRKIAAKLYPSAVPWNSRNPADKHAGFQCLWLQFDHVEPHSHGGRSSVENVVISCALCNFGKDRFTLRQLHIEDPRYRDPEPLLYDGLERLRGAVDTSQGGPKSTQDRRSNYVWGKANHERERYFLPGAWISAGYLNSPAIDGKERWFKLSQDVQAETVVRDGVEGCVLICSPDLLERRGINGSELRVQ
jgi:5-methylcytosine-specific restriction endonuclease McrA